MMTKTDSSVLTHQAKGVMTVTLNRPDVVNAIDESICNNLRNIFTRIKLDDEVRAVIITGSGGNFCAGSDISALENITELQAQSHMRIIRDTAMAIASCTKPVVAALEGHVAGAGLGLALLCDVVISSKSSRFTSSFSRIGLGPEWGLSKTLPDRVGRNRARKLIWDASKLDSETAYEFGIVDELCLSNSAIEVAIDYARKLAGLASCSSMSTKHHFRFPLSDLAIALENEAATQTACFISADFAEGLDAFRNRRKPIFNL